MDDSTSNMAVKFYRWIAITSVMLLEKIDRFFRNKDQQDEQYFLDWQDSLNKISVR